MAAHDRTHPVYMIGVVASLTEMHAQTIRLYERLGLVTPLRKNNIRLYSESDVDRLVACWIAQVPHQKRRRQERRGHDRKRPDGRRPHAGMLSRGC